MEIFVQFSDSSQKTIISTFCCPQDKEIYPNQGTVKEDDERYIALLKIQPWLK